MAEYEFDNDRLSSALEWCRARAEALDRQHRSARALAIVSFQLQRCIVDWSPYARHGVELEGLQRMN
ncbi:hypothetical protein LCGC14_2099480 [marine sediment metagenome]|uniref:Uncharacterized protein n=1 Tax=marine sediment metagenome TaxID=412755 RepID=A0A0F9EAA1_9ZZZZ